MCVYLSCFFENGLLLPIVAYYFEKWSSLTLIQTPSSSRRHILNVSRQSLTNNAWCSMKTVVQMKYQASVEITVFQTIKLSLDYAK